MTVETLVALTLQFAAAFARQHEYIVDSLIQSVELVAANLSDGSAVPYVELYSRLPCL